MSIDAGVEIGLAPRQGLENKSQHQHADAGDCPRNQRAKAAGLSDAVIAVKTDAGPVKLNQLVNTTAAGAASGSFWGLMIGFLFLNPLIGVVLGAASGALSGAMVDYGINDKFMKELSASLTPGHAALFVVAQEYTADKVLKEIQDAGGVVLKTSLDDSKEKMLREALAKASAEEAAASSADSV